MRVFGSSHCLRNRQVSHNGHRPAKVACLGQIDKSSPNPGLILAIGQHYDIKTELLDLTSNLGIAALFATQSWVSIELARILRKYPNFKRPLPNDSHGFICRYDRLALKSLDSTLIDLSHGSAGGRPLLQRGWALSSSPDEDLHFLSRDAYEVFPFQHDPALPALTMRQDDFYCRGNGEHIEELRGLAFWGGTAYGESLIDLSFSPIDLIVPEMTLFPINDDEYILGRWSLGTDLFLLFGEIVESGLPLTRPTNKLQAADMFGSLYGKTMKKWRSSSAPSID